jgi:hypothetical protein
MMKVLPVIISVLVKMNRLIIDVASNVDECVMRDLLSRVVTAVAYPMSPQHVE